MTNALEPLTGEAAIKEIVSLARRLDLTSPLSEAHSYASLPLCVVDAVFSINVRYAVVENIVRDLTQRTGLLEGWTLFSPRDTRGAGEHTISEFLARVVPLGSSWIANRNLTSARGGILKSDAVIRFAQALQAAGVETFTDMKDEKKISSAEAAILAIPGQRSGISFSYFCILAGDDNRIKADRMVQRFVAQAIGLHADQVTPRLASHYLAEAAGLLDVTPARLDNAIWNYMARGESKTS